LPTVPRTEAYSHGQAIYLYLDRLLDWKRLYWNCRDFAQGKRRGHCPYEHLGLRLPTYDAWALLQMDPAQLAQHVSTTKVAA